ncbi:MAG: hypothetical protein RR643_04925 [Anaerorhabdus sp.]|uniref:hypothetical protein n=1 Tax=Anaerorhabdus sp. TaxID=1872524 RepID=UPI002FC9B665
MTEQENIEVVIEAAQAVVEEETKVSKKVKIKKILKVTGIVAAVGVASVIAYKVAKVSYNENIVETILDVVEEVGE